MSFPANKVQAVATTPSNARHRWLRSLAALVALTAVVGVGGVSHRVEAQGKDESINDFFNVNGAGIQRLARQQQEVIAACMKKQGFDYKVLGLGDFADVIGDGLDPDKFAEKYGYGITTLINPEKAGKPATLDANATIVAKMSAAQKKSYNKALTGKETSTPGAGAGGFGAAGCVGESTKKLFASFAKLQALGPKFEEIQSRVNNNPKVLAGMKKWSACMKDGGYTFATDTDPGPSISKEFNEMSKASGAGSGGDAAGLAGAFGGGADISKLDPTKLRALQKKELTISKADRACTKKHLQDRAALQKVEEKKFIDQNRAVLEDVRTELGGKKK